MFILTFYKISLAHQDKTPYLHTLLINYLLCRCSIGWSIFDLNTLLKEIRKYVLPFPYMLFNNSVFLLDIINPIVIHSFFLIIVEKRFVFNYKNKRCIYTSIILNTYFNKQCFYCFPNKEICYIFLWKEI